MDCGGQPACVGVFVSQQLGQAKQRWRAHGSQRPIGPVGVCGRRGGVVKKSGRNEHHDSLRLSPVGGRIAVSGPASPRSDRPRRRLGVTCCGLTVFMLYLQCSLTVTAAITDGERRWVVVVASRRIFLTRKLIPYKGVTDPRTRRQTRRAPVRVSERHVKLLGVGRVVTPDARAHGICAVRCAGVFGGMARGAAAIARRFRQQPTTVRGI